MAQEQATLAGGCFWCTEAIFQRLEGVHTVLPGYAGGTERNPTYEEVSLGTTGHAEAIQIEFDPKVLPYEVLLDIFWHTHDPTTRDRQGSDAGPQYRSLVFYHDEPQRLAAEKMKVALQSSDEYGASIVTEIVPFTNFFAAEAYHRAYYETNPEAAYCRVIITPKLKKLMDTYGERLKSEYL